MNAGTADRSACLISVDICRNHKICVTLTEVNGIIVDHVATGGLRYSEQLPYSDKFSRSKSFAVFADFARTAKIIPSKILHPRIFYTPSLARVKFS